MSLVAMSRRSVLSGFGVTAAAGVIGFALARNSSVASGKRATTAANGYGPATGATARLLAPESQVPEGGGLILGKVGIVLTRDASRGLHAFSATCTHQGCTVNVVKHGRIDCPCHGSRFDAATGAVVAGPAPRPLPMIAVVVRDGNIYTG